jgi:hypothetical protein
LEESEKTIMATEKARQPDMKKVDLKLKWGIALLVVLGFGLWYYTQPHSIFQTIPTIPGLSGESPSPDSGVTGLNIEVVVENDSQAGEELANASRSAASSTSSVDEVLDLLSS